MNKIVLNKTAEFEIISFSRIIYLKSEEKMGSNRGYCVIISNVAPLMAFLDTEITSFEIYHNDNKIYEVSDTVIEIENITEQLNEDKIETSVTFLFPQYLTNDEN